MARAVSGRIKLQVCPKLTHGRIDDRAIPSSCSIINVDEVNNFCPSEEWQKIRDYVSLSSQIVPAPYLNRFRIATSPLSLQLASRSSVRQLTIEESDDYIGQGPRPVMASVQHGAISDVITNTAALWFLSLTNVTASPGHGAPLSDQSDATHKIASNYSQPYSTVVCMSVSVNDTSTSEPLTFPVLPNANSFKLASGNLTFLSCSNPVTCQTIAHPSISWHDSFKDPGPTNEYRMRWVELPQDHFQGSSIGAVIYEPRNESNKTQEVLMCNISAGWGVSELSIQTFNGGASAVSSKNAAAQAKYKPLSIKLVGVPPSQQQNQLLQSTFVDYVLPVYPKQPINITESWAKYLDPFIEDLNTTLINVLLQKQISSCAQHVTAENVLAGLVVNGLSGTCPESRLQGSVRTVGPEGEGGLDGNYWLSGKGNVFDVTPEESVNWTKFHFESTLEGHAYNTINTPPKIAIVVLSIYCLLALVHVFYAGITGKLTRAMFCILLPDYCQCLLSIFPLQASPLPAGIRWQRSQH